MVKKRFVAVVERFENEEASRVASSKARDDIQTTLSALGFEEHELRDTVAIRDQGVLPAFLRHLAHYREWMRFANSLMGGETLFIQYPPLCNTFLLGQVLEVFKKKMVDVVLIIHDVESFRTNSDNFYSKIKEFYARIEERRAFSAVPCLIVHNKKMAEKIAEEYGVASRCMLPIEAFDYIISQDSWSPKLRSKCDPIVIAGNLSREKASYIRILPGKCEYNLYGIGYELDNGNPSVHYRGSFESNELVDVLEGSFGLVWDGDSVDTCSGSYGDYLRLNNPHKMSLYLACGMPVIIWGDAAQASFVREYGVGLTVESLAQAEVEIKDLTIEEYGTMLSNIEGLSRKMRDGGFAREAICAAIKKLESDGN